MRSDCFTCFDWLDLRLIYSQMLRFLRKAETQISWNRGLVAVGEGKYEHVSM